MKTYSASDLGSHKRTEVFEAAKEGGVIIQKKNTNGVVMEEFVLLEAGRFKVDGEEYLAYGSAGLVAPEDMATKER